MRCDVIPNRQNIPYQLRLGVIVLFVISLVVISMSPPVVAFESEVRSRAHTAELTVNVQRVFLPYVNESILFRGDVSESPVTGHYALQAQVRPIDQSRGWTLTIRATEPRFTSSGAMKPCTDLHWKRDDEPGNTYSPVRIQETVIIENPTGGNADVPLDLRSRIGWETSPGSYQLNLALQLRYRE
jgi:hypothetical protein